MATRRLAAGCQSDLFEAKRRGVQMSALGLGSRASPGKVNTSPTNYYPIQAVRMTRFKGVSWELFGDIISSDRTLLHSTPLQPGRIREITSSQRTSHWFAALQGAEVPDVDNGSDSGMPANVGNRRLPSSSR
jgi:hypothetical protein